MQESRLQEKLYPFPGKLSNFSHTRGIREAAGGTEGGEVRGLLFTYAAAHPNEGISFPSAQYMDS